MEEDLTHYRAVLAYNVRRLRELRRVTQRQLAEDIGTPLSQVWAVEHARQNIRLDTLVKIAVGLGVDVRILFDPPSE